MTIGWAIAILLFGAMYLVVFFIRTMINERRKDEVEEDVSAY